MEKAKQVGGSSASSFTSDLFGPKDSSSSSPSSSYGLFGSVFGPPSTVLFHSSTSFNNIFMIFYFFCVCASVRA